MPAHVRTQGLLEQRYVDSPDVPEKFCLVSVASSSKSPSKDGAISKCIPVQVYVVETAGERYLAGVQTGGVGRRGSTTSCVRGARPFFTHEKQSLFALSTLMVATQPSANKGLSSAQAFSGVSTH